MIIETLKTVVTGIVADANTAVALARLVIHNGSPAAEILKVVGPSLGLIGGVAGVIFSGVALANDLKVDIAVTDKFNELVEELKQTEPGELKHTIIMAKLKQLEQQGRDLGVSILQDYVGIVSSTLGIGASIGGIITGSGVAVGLVGTAIISGTGIGAMVLGASALVGGTGYMVYKNRDALANDLQNFGKSIQHKFSDNQLQDVNSEMEILDTKMKLVSEFLQDSSVREQKFKQFISSHKEKLSGLAKDRLFLKSQLPTEGILTNAPIIDRVAAYLNIRGIEGKITEIDQKMVEIGNKIKEARDLEDQNVLNARRRYSKFLSEKAEKTKTSIKLEGQVNVLKAEMELLKKKGDYIAMAKDMGMNYQEVKKFAASLKSEIVSALAIDFYALEPIKRFLTEQNFDLEQEGFNHDPAHAILKYIAKVEATVSS